MLLVKCLKGQMKVTFKKMKEKSASELQGKN